MTSAVLSPAGVAVLFAHLLFIVPSLLLCALAFRQRTRARQLAYGVSAAGFAIAALGLALDWFQRGIVIAAAST